MTNRVLLIANIILLVTSLPSVMQHGGHASEAGLAVFLVLFALGDGAFRAAATAFMGMFSTSSAFTKIELTAKSQSTSTLRRYRV